MEDNAGAVSDGAAEAPFSELISQWLDEGDRLDEDVAASASVTASGSDGPWRRSLSRLREIAARHRLFVLAGVGLLPLALLVATQRVAPPPAIAASVVSVVSTAPPPKPTAASHAPSPPSAIPAARVAVVKPPDRRPAKHRRRRHLVLRDRAGVQTPGSPSPRLRASAH